MIEGAVRKSWSPAGGGQPTISWGYGSFVVRYQDGAHEGVAGSFVVSHAPSGSRVLWIDPITSLLGGLKVCRELQKSCAEEGIPKRTLARTDLGGLRTVAPRLARAVTRARKAMSEGGSKW